MFAENANIGKSRQKYVQFEKVCKGVSLHELNIGFMCIWLLLKDLMIQLKNLKCCEKSTIWYKGLCTKYICSRIPQFVCTRPINKVASRVFTATNFIAFLTVTLQCIAIELTVL